MFFYSSEEEFGFCSCPFRYDYVDETRRIGIYAVLLILQAPFQLFFLMNIFAETTYMYIALSEPLAVLLLWFLPASIVPYIIAKIVFGSFLSHFHYSLSGPIIFVIPPLSPHLGVYLLVRVILITIGRKIRKDPYWKQGDMRLVYPEP